VVNRINPVALNVYVLVPSLRLIRRLAYGGMPRERRSGIRAWPCAEVHEAAMAIELALRGKFHYAYSAAALHPQNGHAFPVGREFAESLGANVSVYAQIPKGVAVLDVGCGAGLDSLIAAGKTGAEGTVIGADFSFPMLARARQGAEMHSPTTRLAGVRRKRQRWHRTAVAPDSEHFPIER
jgi:2-polyprenyl-3-methyl-5-hydroxy-6-metoxy-1,4-benzoquinol methylase